MQKWYEARISIKDATKSIDWCTSGVFMLRCDADVDFGTVMFTVILSVLSIIVRTTIATTTTTATAILMSKKFINEEEKTHGNHDMDSSKKKKTG